MIDRTPASGAKKNIWQSFCLSGPFFQQLAEDKYFCRPAGTCLILSQLALSQLLKVLLIVRLLSLQLKLRSYDLITAVL